MGRRWTRLGLKTLVTVALAVAAVACTETTQEVEPTTTVDTSTTTTTTPPATTTSPPVGLQAVGLYRVDPGTLNPLTRSDAITTGDWISGSISDNGEWLVLNIWIDTEPDTDVVQVVEASTGRIVTDVAGPLMHELRVGNDGAVYNYFEPGSCGGHVGRLSPGETRFETVFKTIPNEFCPWSPMTLIDDRRVGWLGMLDTEPGRQETALMVGDLTDGSSLVIPLPSVTSGMVGQHETDDLVVGEMLEPTVVWDPDRNRALVVHADEPAVTVVDLNSGEATEHMLTERTSWIDGLLAWLIPPAHAKGPNTGVTKDAVLGRSGDMLYVGTLSSELVEGGDGTWSVESTPLGVDVIDTIGWETVTHLEIPADEVALSPDGQHLVASGVALTDSASTSSYRPEGAFIFSTETLELIGHVQTPGEWYPDIQFSADSRYLYVGRDGGGPIRIVDLATGEETDMISGTDQLTVFGEVAMLSTRR